MLKLVKTLLHIVAALLLGGMAALALLSALALLLDLITSLTSVVTYSDTAPGQSGDSAGGSSVFVLVLYAGPLAFLAGMVFLSWPSHWLVFHRLLPAIRARLAAIGHDDTDRP